VPDRSPLGVVECPSPVAGHSAVESCNHQGLHPVKDRHLRVSNRDGEFLQNEMAKPLVFDAFREVEPGVSADGELEDVSGRRESHRQQPWPSACRRVVFSCAPAIEMRISSPSAIPKGMVWLLERIVAISASERFLPSIVLTTMASTSLGRVCTAPAQSRPMCQSRSKLSLLFALKRASMRLLTGSLSGSRLSKKFCTISPEKRAFPRGSESDRGRRLGDDSHSS